MLRMSYSIFPHMRNENGQFVGFSSPRYTQVPDELFDELLSELSGSEVKVLLYVVRRTFGFKRDSDHISLSQMTNGIQKKDGSILDKGTGLDKKTVIRAVRALVSKGILVHTRKSSPENGNESSEYALNIVNTPWWNNTTRPLVEESPQALVEKDHTQDTDQQKTSITFSNTVNKPIRRVPVDKSTRDKREYMARQILEQCRDKRSLAFYRKIVRLLPERAIHEALSQVKEAEQLGRIRERPGAMFTDLIKRKAKELGIDFTKDDGANEMRAEQESRPAELSAPSEIMMVGRYGRR
ncbi:hypothetical protein TRIP_C20329 [Candidatus Zixiibacteriota bacterium]|nr:hypothetical protein TRIP_C20329 [candidate division Zixibacteria bacterium]